MTERKTDWTALANDIRAVDGNHDLGAGELAARLIERGWTRELDVERLADMAEMAAGEVMTGADWGRYHKAIREHFKARLERAAEYAALSETSHD